MLFLCLLLLRSIIPAPKPDKKYVLNLDFFNLYGDEWENNWKNTKLVVAY